VTSDIISPGLSVGPCLAVSPDFSVSPCFLVSACQAFSIRLRGLKASRIGLLAAALFVGSCAAFTPAERPAYEGEDTVGSLSAECIVGRWDVTPLNPLPGQASGSATPLTRVIYRADGIVVADLQAPVDDANTFDGAQLRLTGAWQVVDGQVVHDDVVMSTPSDNRSAQLLVEMVNQSQAGAQSIADVSELSAEYMILVGRDGVAMHYARRPANTTTAR